MSQALKFAAALGGAAASGNSSLYQIISDLGLTTNLKLCLDAGDANSYNPAVQTAKWLDTSGNGYDFYRGSSSAGDAAEPTFNGSAGGLSSSEYFSFDGGDYLLYDTTTEAWMQTLHKDGAVVSGLAVFRSVSSTSPHRLFSTRPTGATGAAFIQTSTNVAQFSAFNGATQVGQVVSTATATTNGTNAFLFSLNENGGSNNGLIKVNGNSVETSTVSFASPSTSNATGTPAIGALASGSTPNPSGSRIYMLAIWEGTALTATNLTDLYNAIKGRFGL